jgi:hypothetical protein
LAPDPCPKEPPDPFDPLEETVSAGTELMRIHDQRFPGDGFNPWTHTSSRPTRFAPFAGPSDTPVPTLYAAFDFATAVAESLFHDLPREADELQVARSRLDSLVVSRLEVVTPLRVASLRSRSLLRLRVEWNRLLGSPPGCYARTQTWARAAHRDPRGFHGVLWHSRQMDGAPALMLFGDSRLEPGALVLAAPSAPLSESPYLEQVEAECEAANILLTLP